MWHYSVGCGLGLNKKERVTSKHQYLNTCTSSHTHTPLHTLHTPLHIHISAHTTQPHTHTFTYYTTPKRHVNVWHLVRGQSSQYRSRFLLPNPRRKRDSKLDNRDFSGERKNKRANVVSLSVSHSLYCPILQPPGEEGPGETGGCCLATTGTSGSMGKAGGGRCSSPQPDSL